MTTLTSEPIDHDRPLFDAGLDSLGILDLIEQLEQRFAVKVPPTLLYDYPTIRELAAYFSSQDASALKPSAAEVSPPRRLSHGAH
jgi:polyketide synthase PksN